MSSLHGHRVLVADSQPAVAAGVAALLAGEAAETSAATTDAEALEVAESWAPDLVVLSSRLARAGDFALLRRLAGDDGQPRIVVYGAARNAHLLAPAVTVGAHGVVLKESPLADLLDCLRTVASGGQWVDPRLPASEGSHCPSQPLTGRERQVAILVATGRRNREIAEGLHLTESSVKVYVHRAYRKTRRLDAGRAGGVGPPAGERLNGSRNANQS